MFCKNCGTQLPENASVCPKCGQAVDSTTVQPAGSASVSAAPKKKKQIVWIAAAVVLVAIIGALATWYFLRPKDPGYYQDTPWGTSYEEFTETHPNTFGKQDDDGAANVVSLEEVDPLQGFEEEVLGGTTIVLYKFDREGLYKTTWDVLDSERVAELLPEVIEKYSKLYGKPVRNDDPSVDAKFEEYNYVWKTKESVIQLLAVPEDQGMIVSYYEIGHWTES